MKLGQIVAASPALQKLIYQDLPLNKAYALCKLVDQLNPQLVFFERELCKLGPDDARRMELLEFNVPELDGLQRIQICCSDSIRLSVADLKNLEPFVIFTEEVNGA